MTAAHQAAVRAVELALETTNDGGLFVGWGTLAEAAVVAVATDPDVRAALVAVATEALRPRLVSEQTPHAGTWDEVWEQGGAAEAADAILAALAPKEATLVEPWDAEWWKPSADPIRNLEKAGALIAAGIDRLIALRPAEPEEGGSSPAV